MKKLLSLYYRLHAIADRTAPVIYRPAFKYRRVIKYIAAGGTAAAVNIVLLYVFTDMLKIWYVVSSMLSFAIAFVVSFVFQKFWAFGDRSIERVHVQAAVYLMLALANLALNTFLVYCQVEFFGIYYLLAQVFAGVFIACENFFVYRYFIFRTAPAN